MRVEAPRFGPAPSTAADRLPDESAWAYMVRCPDGSLYAGWTNDLARRLRAHKRGTGARYTRMKGGASLAYAERCADKSAALRREAALKRLSKADKEGLAAAWQRDNRVTLRWAVPEDGGAVAQLYNWYVTHSTATFQYDTVTAAQYEQFVADTLRSGPFLLAESADGRLLGYACAHPWHTRQAYAWDAETTIYCAPEAVGQGVGRRLYGALLAALRRQGYHNAFALVASPNPQSDAFHRAMGFIRFGLEAHTGYKFGQWLGLSYWQLALRREDDAPLPVRLTLTEAEKSEVLEEFF